MVERLLSRRRQAVAPAIPPQPRTGVPFPVSFAQQRMWFLQQLVPASSAFSVAQGLVLRGDLDRAALAGSIADLIGRHESLRTTFTLVDGQPMQCVAPALDVPLDITDMRALDPAVRLAQVAREARTELRRQWDLARGPLVRVRVWQVDDREYAFFLGLHHIVCDGWSMSVLLRELIESYSQRAAGGAPQLADLPVQYADYSVWHRRWLEGPDAAAHLAAWERLLTGAPRLHLPASTTSAAEDRSVGKRVTLSADVTQKLKALATAQSVTPFMVLLAAYAILLSRYSGQDDVVVGSPLASRTHAELENVVGCFMNPLPFRVDLSGNPTFRQLIDRVSKTALDVYAHQDVPFDALVRRMDPLRQSEFPPLYQAMFLFQNFPWEQRAARLPIDISAWSFLATGDGDQDTELVSDQVFPVSLDLLESGGVITGFLEYTAPFAGALANAPADFQEIVKRFVSQPDQNIAVRGPVPAGVGSTSDVRIAAADVVDVYAAFERHVASTPDAPAVVAGSRQLTYRELHDRVVALAAQLGAVPADAPVAVLMDRSPDLIAALLAVLRAGAAYLPLDPALPRERLAYMLDHARVSRVLTSRDMITRADSPAAVLDGRAVICVDDSVAPTSALPPAAVSGAALAYVLYTSGSSGRPKAVAIPRSALANYVAVARARFELRPDDRVLQFASLSFDTAAEEIFPALTSGAALVLRDEAMLRSMPAFLAACGEAGITVLDLPTAFWHELTAQVARGALRVPPSIRLVILGGEKALAPRVREWRAAVGTQARLLNTYGPTESTIVATMWDLTRPDGREEIAIGRAVDNVEAHVLDREGQRVAAGTAGELYIGGAQLARGYLNDPALTAERFVPNPFGAAGSRLYRTGDLASSRTDGVLDFGGRADDQVKLRGFRIEPGEVEAALLQHAAVLEAFVTVAPDRSGDTRLVAYVVGFDGQTLAGDALRVWLQERLPDYMIPSAFTFLDRLPRTVQRKVDRAALPAVQWEASSGQPYQAPQNQLEARIAAVWAEVLERQRVGVHDNFFDLGGHSLLVIKLHARLCEELGADLSPVDLFQFTTVSSQAERLAQGAPSATVARTAAQDRAARQRQAFRRMAK